MEKILSIFDAKMKSCIFWKVGVKILLVNVHIRIEEKLYDKMSMPSHHNMKKKYFKAFKRSISLRRWRRRQIGNGNYCCQRRRNITAVGNFSHALYNVDVQFSRKN